MRPKGLIRRYLIAVGLAISVVIVDLLTKRLASIELVDEPIEIIPGFLSLIYVENPGAAFSLLPGAGPFVGLAAIAVAIGVLWSLRKVRPTLEVVAFGLIVGGAIGNLVDRIFRGDGFLDGKVIDWIDLWWIPTFNIADMAITVAVGLLLVQAWLTR
ncbi:MAG: signal peptidase II [Actinobacteria bacterium]|nr:signal peptidase II [Actinomycetota bacterium]